MAIYNSGIADVAITSPDFGPSVLVYCAKLTPGTADFLGRLITEDTFEIPIGSRAVSCGWVQYWSRQLTQEDLIDVTLIAHDFLVYCQ